MDGLSTPTRRLRGRPGFAVGLACGAIAVFGIRLAINETPVADWLVSPLLMSDTGQTADAIVVPGAGVITACVPNNNAVRRVLLAARLWREGRAPLVVFSGGTGSETCSVATAMARLATEAGVPEASVRTEEASRSTHENAALTAPLLRSWRARRLLVVTDRLHMRRASGVFTQLGFDVGRASVPIYEGHADNLSMLAAGLREMAALAYYRARGWLGDPATTSTGTTERAANASPGQPSPVAPGTPMHIPLSAPSGPIVILGASYAQGWTIGHVAGVPVVNRGVAGQQSFEMLARFDADVVAPRPRAVLLWGLINDVSRAPAGEMDAVLDRTFDSYVRMIALAKQHGIEPVLATELTARPSQMTWLDGIVATVATAMGRQSYQDGVNTHVLAMNRRLTELAARENLLTLDFQGLLAEESGGRRRKVFTQPDGSHITEAGYRTLTAYAAPILEARLVKGER